VLNVTCTDEAFCTSATIRLAAASNSSCMGRLSYCRACAPWWVFVQLCFRHTVLHASASEARGRTQDAGCGQSMVLGPFKMGKYA
jgi:hypothetical protein